MRIPIVALATTAVLYAGCSDHPQNKEATSPSSNGQYLFVWAGDSAEKESDFITVIDASPSSPQYGSVVTTLPTGVAGSHPHHTEDVIAPNGHLLANGFHAGRTWLFDLSSPKAPKILTSFDSAAGFSHPHTFLRLANGNVLATFQYAADPSPTSQGHSGSGMSMGAENRTTGGLVEMDERGTVIRSARAADSSISDKRIYPYSVLPIPALDRAVSTTTDMDSMNVKATGQWIQLWRFSDLKLLHTVALAPGPRGDENQFTGEPRLLDDGKTVYVHTFSCGIYLLHGLDSDQPTSTLVHSFKGKYCGVPLRIGHYWLQTVSYAHTLVALDISDPEHPREVSSVNVGDDEQPHWIASDSAGSRIVMNSAGAGSGNRLFIIDFDQKSGALTMDERFRDPGASRPGVRFSARPWAPGKSYTAVPHGAVFSFR